MNQRTFFFNRREGFAFIAANGDRMRGFFTDRTVFSNHHGCQIEYQGTMFSSSEQLHMTLRARYCGDEVAESTILGENNPREIKKMTNRRDFIKGFSSSDWANVKLEIMAKCQILKYGQDAHLASALLATQETLLETSPGDHYWGSAADIGQILETGNWRGQNFLGRLLTQLRRIIASPWHDKIREAVLLESPQALAEIAAELVVWTCGNQSSGDSSVLLLPEEPIILAEEQQINSDRESSMSPLRPNTTLVSTLKRRLGKISFNSTNKNGNDGESGEKTQGFGSGAGFGCPDDFVPVKKANKTKVAKYAIAQVNEIPNTAVGVLVNAGAMAKGFPATVGIPINLVEGLKMGDWVRLELDALVSRIQEGSRPYVFSGFKVNVFAETHAVFDHFSAPIETRIGMITGRTHPRRGQSKLKADTFLTPTTVKVPF